MKKIIAAISAFLMLISLAACGNENKDEITTAENLGGGDIEETEVTNEQDVPENENVTEIVTEIVTNLEGETEIVTDVVTKKPSTSNVGTYEKKDPSEWTAAEVVNFYKKACNNSTSVISTQTMVMRQGTIKCDGVSEGLLSLADGLIRVVMNNQKTDTAGITGGYKRLTVNDCKTAKAYKDGDYTIVEMTMKDQTDGANGDTFSGTVGHAISVVGGVEMVVDKFKDWNVEYKDGDIKIHYTEAKVKVRINSDGVIEKGTWSYVTTPEVNGLKIIGLDINNAGCVIDYKVVVGGGF